MSWPLNIASIRETSFDFRTVGSNFQAIDDYLRGNGPGMPLLAELLGGQFFSGVVFDSLAAPPSNVETRFAHSLGRVPILVLLSRDVVGIVGDGIRGQPQGGLTLPGNITPWTTTEIFVGATDTSTYNFIVV